MISGSMPGIRSKDHDGVATWQMALAFFAGSFLLYLININRFPHPDELYHVLAARGILETGEPRIAEGIYERVYFHTWLIAQLFAWLGDSLIVARLPSAFAMAGTVALMFVWLRHQAGFTAAWIGTGLFAISPFAVDIAQFARFYGLQTITFFTGATLVYAAVENLQNRRWQWAAMAVPCLLAAIYFQDTTLIGIVGLGTWVVLRIAVPWLQSEAVPSSQKIRAGFAILILGLLGICGAWALGLLGEAWQTYRSVPLFNRSQANEFWYYHAWYNLLYPSFWPALGIIGLAAIAYRPGPAFFAATVFILSFLLNSFAAPKSLRYLIYAQPFAFLILGMGLAMVLAPLQRWLGTLRDHLATVIPLSLRMARKTSSALIVLALGVLIVGNPAVLRTVTLLADVTIPPERPPVDWVAAQSDLQPWFEKADVVVTMAELEMLYYYDRYDILLSASRLGEIPGGQDFDPDFRTGRPVIASIDSMTKVLACYPIGIIVTNSRRWRDTDLISLPIANLIALNTKRLDLPEQSKVVAFGWDRSDIEPLPEYCEGIPSFRPAPVQSG